MRSIGPLPCDPFCRCDTWTCLEFRRWRVGVCAAGTGSGTVSISRPTCRGVALKISVSSWQRRCRQALSPATAGAAIAEPAWAPADSATVHPGVQTFTEGAQCTSNFVFYDGSNNVYIGQAAHCSGTGGNTETNGCDSRVAAERHAGRGRRRQPARDHGLQLVAGDAGQGRAERRHLPGQRLRAGAARSRGCRQSTRRSRSGAAPWASPTRPRPARRSSRTATRRWAGVTQLSPKEGKSLGNESDGGWRHRSTRRRPGSRATRAARSSTATARRSAF